VKLEIELINEQTEYTLTEDTLKRIEAVLNQAANAHEMDGGEVVLSFVDDLSIQHLNRDYRGIDRPTDVLSFAMSETGEGEMEIIRDEEDDTSPISMLGDIVISVPRAMAQAEEYGHSIERELCFLAVHGFLHLIGYDHGNEEEEKKMFELQEQILQEVGVTRD
jgi:probable rRNA maturation factor